MSTTFRPRKRDPHVCMRCGTNDPQTSYYADTLNFKGLTIDVEGLAQTKCGSCGLIWQTDGQDQDNLSRMRDAFAVKRDAVRTRDGLLTGEQVEFVLSQLELTRARAATLFGGGPNAFAKYISGEVLQSVAMDRLLRLALAFGEPAVRYLEQGRDAPLQLRAAGVYLSEMPAASVGWAEPAYIAGGTEVMPTESQKSQAKLVVSTLQVA
jgi:putative zinc finger/helix-turn-helix YgiT family protein